MKAKRRPSRRQRQRRHAALAAVAAVAAGLALAAYAADVLEHVELDAVDAHFSLRGKQDPPRDVVIVAIDDVTFDELQRRWPFPRRLHAKLLDRLRSAGVRAIGYDVQFTEPTNPVDDNALIESAARAPRLVLGTTEVDARGRANVFGGEQVLHDIGARAASASLNPDADGVQRRMSYSIDRLKTLAVAVTERATGKRVSPDRFDGGEVPIDFVGPPGTIRAISFSRVLAGEAAPALLRGRIVIVGAAAPSLQDVHATAASRSEQMSGAEIQANGVHTILSGIALQETSPWLDVLLIVALALVAPVSNLRLHSWRVLAIVLATGAGYAAATQAAFAAGLIVPVVYPLFALAFAGIGTLSIDYLFEAFEREHVHDVFARFVPETVVDDVLARTDERRLLGGEERVCTVMFCDLRGFTSFSEGLAAGEVIDVVNVYLGEMTDAILAAGGTIAAYMGDGIFALFGAPLPRDDHADRALAAAREMMGERLSRFNAWLAEQGYGHAFRMGIGLNSGSVMAGNVGTDRRLEYTAIGDTTNTASRLEGMTKGSGHMLFMADSTRTMLTIPPSDLVSIGEFDVRGREQKLHVWSVPDPPQAATAPRSASSS